MSVTQPITVVMAASIRRASVNAALARLIVDALRRRGEHAELIDLADYDMPIYHGDIEAEAGVPDAARELVDRFGAATRLVIVTPEYNGAWPPLLKNTLDWMSRIERGFFRHMTIHLAAASPGGLGGRRVLAILRAWLENMRADVADTTLSVPNASLSNDLELVADGVVDVDTFLPPERG